MKKVKKHVAPAATAEQLRKAAGISDKMTKEVRKRLKKKGKR